MRWRRVRFCKMPVRLLGRGGRLGDVGRDWNGDAWMEATLSGGGKERGLKAGDVDYWDFHWTSWALFIVATFVAIAVAVAVAIVVAIVVAIDLVPQRLVPEVSSLPGVARTVSNVAMVCSFGVATTISGGGDDHGDIGIRVSIGCGDDRVRCGDDHIWCGDNHLRCDDGMPSRCADDLIHHEKSYEASEQIKKPADIINRVTGEKNPKYKAASESVGFDFSESEGRFAQAESDLQSGDVILREPPHCSVLLQENAKTHCFQCMKRCYFIEPCQKCSAVIFCGPKCQQMAYKTHHKHECEVLKTLWESGASITCLMALRIIIQKPFAYFLKVGKELEANGRVGSRAEYDGADYSTVFDLVRHEDKRSTEGMFHKTYMALFLQGCLKRSGYFYGNSDLSGEEQSKAEMAVGGLILRHLQSLQFNAHEISEMIFTSPDPKTWKSIFVGAGLYPTLALFNHSCEPSIIRYFEGNKVVVRVIKNIKKGEKIYENYGPIFTQTPKAERQATLKNQYWFECSCEPCSRNWPMLDGMDVSTMRFPCDDTACDNVVVVPVNTGSFMMQCNKCGRLTNIMKGLKVLQDSESLFRLGESFLQGGEIHKALRKFLELQSLLSNTLVPPFRDFYLCQQNVRNCIMALGNTHPPLDKFVQRQSVNLKKL
ncbi:hypothetical protein GE061_020040 [Apolygus lucorum]|uniref:Protein-lysine N-methyltransferase SMYD4 n=1 Tax=Apolygus lucorum TaxID=248454 RepID=A0A8S9XCR3_APOLU|nr:hypothetical protein GE061_020040 [Apolygus lucorum]